MATQMQMQWREIAWPPASCEARVKKDKTESGNCFCIRVVLSVLSKLRFTNLEYGERESATANLSER